MNKNTKQYHFLRFITVCLTTLMLPLGTYVGYQFGTGNTPRALTFLAIQTLVTFIQAYIWWFTLEKVNKK